MNSTRQIIRWSLPGLVFVLNLLIFHGLWRGFIAHTPPWAYINEATAPALVAVVAGGLPGGFLIYQIYFHSYRPVGPIGLWRVALFRFYRQDRGASILNLYFDKYKGSLSLLTALDQRDSTEADVKERIGLPELKRKFGLFARPEGRQHLHVGSDLEEHSAGKAWWCRECADTYIKRWDGNWILLQTTIDYCASPAENRWIKDEYISGSDLYHGIGAARAAVWLAFLTSLGYDGIVRPLLASAPPDLAAQPWNYVGVVGSTLALTGFQVFVLTRSRNQTARVYHARIAASLAMLSRSASEQEHRKRALPWPFGNRGSNPF